MGIKYEPTKWENGKTVLRASHFEKIEKGITDIIQENHLIYIDEDNRKANEVKREAEHSKKIKELDTFVDGLNSDYDSLKKVIIDENASANLQNQINNVSSQLAHMTHKKYNVKDYGAKGDGLTDDSEAIRKCIEALPESNFELIFPPGVYMQGDGTYNTEDYENTTTDNVNKGIPIYFEFKDKTNFKITGYEAIIKAHHLNGCIVNNKGFEFVNCNDFIIEGLTYNGSILERHPQMGDPSGYNSQSGFTFAYCKNGQINNVNSSYCCMDGFTIKSLIYGIDRVEDAIVSENLFFNNCKGLYNYRQGASVVTGNNVVFKNCEFSYNGTIFGTSPMSGIDFEEGYIEPLGLRGQNNCMVDNCTFINNAGSGVMLHWGTHNSTIKKSLFKNNGVYIPNDSEGKTINNTIRENTFYNSSVDVGGGGDYIIDNIFYQDDISREGFKVVINQPSEYVVNNQLARVSKIQGNSFINLTDFKKCYGDVKAVGMVWILNENSMVINNTWNNCLAPNNILFPYLNPILSENNTFILSENKIQNISEKSLGILSLCGKNSFNNSCSHYYLYTPPANGLSGVINSEEYNSDKFRLVKRVVYSYFSNEYVKISIRKQSYTKIRFSGTGQGVENAPYYELIYFDQWELMKATLLGPRKAEKLMYDTVLDSEGDYVIYKLKLDASYGKMFIEIDSIGNKLDSADKDNIKIELLPSDNLNLSTFTHIEPN